MVNTNLDSRVPERTQRERIDELMLKAGNLMMETKRAANQLSMVLTGKQNEPRPPETTPAVGWLNEIEHNLTVITDDLIIALEIINQLHETVSGATISSNTPQTSERTTSGTILRRSL